MVSDRSSVLMSIRPPYAEAILAGHKTVELRRRRPGFAPGTTVLIYVTAPQQRVVGAFDVAGVIEAPPTELWPLVRARSGVDRAVYDSYFDGCSAAYAIEVTNVRRIKPATLGMRPPQSYLMLRPEQPRHRRLLHLADQGAAAPRVPVPRIANAGSAIGDAAAALVTTVTRRWLSASRTT